MGGIYKVGLMVGVLALAAWGAKAQAIAEAATTNSNASTVASGIKLPPLAMPLPSPGTGGSSSPSATFAGATNGSSPHLVARTGPPPDQVNRKDFEDNAGEKAGKLLLRSVPTGADIFVNDRLVGHTPLLMVVAPGKYKIDMRGPREEFGHSSVGVMPKETETVVINLTQRYPISVSPR